MVAVGTRVQSYPFRTLATASFISLLSSCGDGVEPGKDVDVADVLICIDVAVAAATDAAVVAVMDEVGERDKEPEPSISKLSSQKQTVQFQKYTLRNSQIMNEHSEPPADQI